MAIRRNIFWGMLAVAVGAVWLGLTVGAFPPGLADLMVRGAPVVLVAVGLGALLRGRVPFSGLIALALAGAVVVNIALVAYSTRATQERTEQVVPVSVPVGEEVTLLVIDLSALATDVQVALDSSLDRALVGQFTGSTESLITADYAEEGARATFTLREVQPNAFQLLEAVGRGDLTLRLPADLGIDLAVRTEQGTVVLNLDGTQLERLNLDLLRGDAIITLPSYQPQSASQADTALNGTLTVRDGAITVSVPDDVGARLELNRAGSALQPEYDDRVYNYLVGDVLESRDFDSADTQLRYALVAPRGLIRITATAR